MKHLVILFFVVSILSGCSSNISSNDISRKVSSTPLESNQSKNIPVGNVSTESESPEDVSPESEPSTLIISEQVKVNEEQALEKINNLISDGTITLQDINCEVQYFFKNEEGFHVIRIAFVDPNNPEFTVTTARYLVSEYTGEVFEEELFSGELTEIAE